MLVPQKYKTSDGFGLGWRFLNQRRAENLARWARARDFGSSKLDVFGTILSKRGNKASRGFYFFLQSRGELMCRQPPDIKVLQVGGVNKHKTTFGNVVYPFPRHPSAWCLLRRPRWAIACWSSRHLDLSDGFVTIYLTVQPAPQMMLIWIHCAYSAPTSKNAKRLSMLTHSSSTTNELVIVVLREASSHFQLGLAMSIGTWEPWKTPRVEGSLSLQTIWALLQWWEVVSWLKTPNVWF